MMNAPRVPVRFPVRIRRALLAIGLLACAATGVHAQAAKPIRLIVAGPPGGNADIVARQVGEAMSRELGQPVLVDPKPGAGGAIAIGELLQAPQDGTTFMVGVNSIVSEIPHIMKMRFDPSKELRPVAELARGGLVLVGHPSVPAKNLRELIAYAKANPGKLNYASYSAGTMSHVLGLILNRAAGIELVHVGYKGSSPALVDVMGNHVPLMFDGVPTSLPLIRGGKIKAFAISTPNRIAQLPDVPTFRELGYPQVEALAWIGLWSTPKVPAAAQARVHDAALKVLNDPKLHALLMETGFEPGQPRGVEQMQEGLRGDYARVGEILKSINFQPE